MIKVKIVLYAPGMRKLPMGPYVQCFVCGEKHFVKQCLNRDNGDELENFCVTCLIPLWNTDGVHGKRS